MGRAFEEVYARRLEEHAAELAEHFSQSTETADLEKAVRYGELAAHRAMTVFAYGEAVRHLEQALRAQEVLDADDDAKACDLLLALGEALIACNDRPRVLDETAPAALRLAENLADQKRAFAACGQAIDATIGSLTTPPSYWLELAGRYAGDDPYSQIRLKEASARALVASGRSATGTALRRQALELARGVGDIDAEVRSAWGLLQFADLDPGEEREIIDSLSGRLRTGVSILNQASFLGFAAFCLLARGHRAAAESLVKDLSVIASRSQGVALATSTAMNATIAILDGRLREGLDSALEAAVGLRGGGFGQWFVISKLLGEFDFSQAENLLATIDADSFGARLTQVVMNAEAGRLEEARSSLRELVPEAEWNSLNLASFLQAATLLADLPAVEEAYRLLREKQGAWALLVSSVILPRLLGQAATLLGLHMQAREHYEEALDFCIEVRHRPGLALSHLDLAELLLEHYPEERDAAIEHLDFAIGEFREMKMQPSLERALRHRGLLKA